MGGGGAGGREAPAPFCPVSSTSPPRAPRLRPRALSPARTLPRVNPARARPRPDPPSPPTSLPRLTRGPRRAPHALVRNAGVSPDCALLTGSRRSGSPDSAHRQRPPRTPQPLHRGPGAACSPARPLARSQPAAIPRAARPCAWSGRSSAEPPRGRTGKRGWSRPSPRNTALPAALPVHSARRRLAQASPLLQAPGIKAQMSRSGSGPPMRFVSPRLGGSPVC